MPYSGAIGNQKAIWISVVDKSESLQIVATMAVRSDGSVAGDPVSHGTMHHTAEDCAHRRRERGRPCTRPSATRAR